MKWLVVVNPMAGGGRAGKKWKRTGRILSEREIPFEAVLTNSPASTRGIVSAGVKRGFDGIAVYGGDGTLSDAASVIAGMPQGPVLAVLPAGSGNDWARSIGFLSPAVEMMTASMKKESFRTVDTAVARWQGGQQFFLNSGGIGLDAFVLRKSLASRKFLGAGKPGYLINLALAAMKPPSWEGVFTSHGEEFHRGKYLTFTAGVGSYSGGGMRLSPEAVPDDGLLSGLCLSPMGFLDIAANIRRVFNGTLHRTTWASSGKGDTLRVEGPGLILELDGEIRQIETDWLEFISVPKSLRVLKPCPV